MSWSECGFPWECSTCSNSEMSRNGEGTQEGEREKDDQGTPGEGAAGAVTPAMLEQLEGRLVERIMAQLASQGDPKGVADTRAPAKEGEPGGAARCGASKHLRVGGKVVRQRVT